MEFKTIKLGDLYDVASGLSKSAKEFGTGEFPFLSFKTVFYNYFLPNELPDNANTTEIEQFKCSIQAGDLFLTRTSETVNELGMSSVALKDYPYATFNGFSKRLRLKSNAKLEVYPKYMGYYLRSFGFRSQINSMSIASTRASLNIEMINRLTVNLPDLKSQKKIGNFLFLIDQKISNNKAINRNLEEQITAVFEELRNDVETKIVKVGDLTLTSNTGADAIQKAPIVDEDTGIRCVRVGDMTNDRPVYEWGFSKVEPDVFKQYQLHKDDIVVTRTATLGINRLITEDLNAVYNNGLIRISLDKSKADPLFVFRQLQLQDFVNYIARINGETSTRPNMKMNYFLSYEFKLPDIEDQHRIVDQITELYQLQQKLIAENKELVDIREVLLPKLMSGELDVSNLEI